MRKNFWDKRIPTLLGLLIISVGLIVTTFIVNGKTVIQTNASPTEQPQNVRVSNIAPDSFTVSYSTQSEVAGSVNYGKDASLGQTDLDERDSLSGKVSFYKLHYITIKNLNPATAYYFTILSAGNSYYNNNSPFVVTTAPMIAKNTPSNVLSGKIILPNGDKPSAALIYLNSDDSQVISTIGLNGEYKIDISNLRKNDLSSYLNLENGMEIKMLVAGEEFSSNVSYKLGADKNLPTITLSKDYDFQDSDFKAIKSANLSSFPSFGTTKVSTSSAKSPKILSPSKNQEFTQQQPIFKGTALPKEDVEITIHSDEQINAVVSTDASGNWTYTPTQQLSPGQHTITIVTRDATGILKTITQTFVVQASAQETLPTTTTPTPTPDLSSSLTASPSPTSILPATGNPAMIGIGIIGVIISVAGSLLFLLSRKKI